MIQILLMCYNSHETIIQCIESYIGKVDRLCVYIDNKTTDDTLQLVKSMNKLVKIKIGFFDFINFEQARNLCIEMSDPDKYEWTIFLDDSYILHGSFEELKKLPKSYKCISLKIKRSGQEYFSKRGIRKGSGLRFKNEVHEVLDSYYHWPLPNCYIEDLACNSQAVRTKERIYSDLKYFSGRSDPRSLYYYAGLCYQLFSQGEISADKVIHAYEVRIATPCDHYEETYMCFMFIASIYILQEDKISAIKNYLAAAIIYTPRCGEAYYNVYMLTGNKFYLKKAFENRDIQAVLPTMASTKNDIEMAWQHNEIIKELNDRVSKFNS